MNVSATQHICALEAWKLVPDTITNLSPTECGFPRCGSHRSSPCAYRLEIVDRWNQIL